jgi:hypothetical protein
MMSGTEAMVSGVWHIGGQLRGPGLCDDGEPSGDDIGRLRDNRSPACSPELYDRAVSESGPRDGLWRWRNYTPLIELDSMNASSMNRLHYPDSARRL